MPCRAVVLGVDMRCSAGWPLLRLDLSRWTGGEPIRVLSPRLDCRQRPTKAVAMLPTLSYGSFRRVRPPDIVSALTYSQVRRFQLSYCITS